MSCAEITINIIRMLAKQTAMKMKINDAPVDNKLTKATWPGSPQTTSVVVVVDQTSKPASLAIDANPTIVVPNEKPGTFEASTAPVKKVLLFLFDKILLFIGLLPIYLEFNQDKIS